MSVIDIQMLCESFGIPYDTVDVASLLVNINERVKLLEARFTAPEPEPACKQNQEWMLNELEEQELERDISLVKDD